MRDDMLPTISWRKWRFAKQRPFTRSGANSSSRRGPSLEALEDRLAPATGPFDSLALPLLFESNRGQANATTDYLARGQGYRLLLDETGATLALANQGQDAVLRLGLVGSNPAASITGTEPTGSYSNYLYGNDPTSWLTEVPHFGKVQVANVYPGIDAIYYGTQQRELEYDFVVAPDADARQIRLRFEGAESMRLDAQGNLVLHLKGGDVTQKAPVLYQTFAGVRQAVEGGYVLHVDGTVGFRVGTHDPSRTLVIDPILTYFSYIGEGGVDQVDHMALDSANNVYLTATTTSTNLPVRPSATAVQRAFGGQTDTFVMKLDGARPNQIAYLTYLGGSDHDTVQGIAVTSAGQAVVVGRTLSANFPVASAHQTTLSPSFDGTTRPDAFVTKLNAAGTGFVHSTYLGGRGDDEAVGVAIDTAGNTVVGGNALGDQFRGDPENRSLNNAGLYRPRGTDGNGVELLMELTLGVDQVRSARFITDSASVGQVDIDFTFASAPRITAAGTFDFTLIGTRFANEPLTVRVLGTVTAPGVVQFSLEYTQTRSNGPGISGSVTVTTQRDGPNEAGFLTQFNAAGVFQKSTFLDNVTLKDLAGAGDRLAIAGETNSFGRDLPLVNAAQSRLNGDETILQFFFRDAFVGSTTVAAALSRVNLGDSFIFATLFGGRDEEFVSSVAINSAGEVAVGGSTLSTDLPIVNQVQAQLAGELDGFVTRYGSIGQQQITTYLGGKETDEVLAVAIDSLGQIHAAGGTASRDDLTTPANEGFPVRHTIATNLQEPNRTPLDLDGFLVKLDKQGQAFLYSTLLGGAGDDIVTALAVRDVEITFVAGSTGSPSLASSSAPDRNQVGFEGFVGIVRQTIVVNTFGDAPDANPNDGVADSDTSRPGLQTTLRAALDHLSSNPGLLAGQTVQFDLPLTAEMRANRRAVLEIAGEIELDANFVTIDGFSHPQIITIVNGGFSDEPVQIEIRGGGILVKGDNNVLQGLRILDSSGVGIGVLGGKRNRIQQNHLENAASFGISLVAGSEDNIIEENEILRNRAGGVALADASLSNDLVDNTIENNQGHGIEITGDSGDNFITSTTRFTTILGNSGDGIRIEQSAGTSVDTVQIRANRGAGVRIVGVEASFTTISGSEIGGTGVGGVAGNADGVVIEGAGFNLVRRNFIADNRGDGIRIEGAAATDNDIFQNQIGMLPDGTIIPNSGAGIKIQGGASQNNIGRILSLTHSDGDGLDDDGRHDVTGELLPPGGLDGDGFDDDGKDDFSGDPLPPFAPDGDGFDDDGKNDLTGETLPPGGPDGDGIDDDYIDDTTGQQLARVQTSNVIVGSIGPAIHIVASNNNKILGNHIGARGTLFVGDGGEPPLQAFVRGFNLAEGILIEGDEFDGDDTLIEQNVIAGNAGHGIRLVDAGRTKILRNLIGVDPLGTPDLGNGGDGIRLEAGTVFTHIGEGPLTDDTPRLTEINVIRNNTGNGVTIVGEGAVENTIRNNSIFENGKLGIDLGDDGPSNNDNGDADRGSNEKQNAPSILAYTPRRVLVGDAFQDGTEIRALLRSLPARSYRIELYANARTDSSGFGEGQKFLAEQTVTTNDQGIVTFTMTVPFIIDEASMTATDSEGNTSEFGFSGKLVVNDIGDRPDADPFDDVPDVDLATPGLQTTLRSALQFANLDPNRDTIRFDIAGVDRPVVELESDLPAIEQVLTIDGSTQLGGRVFLRPATGSSAQIGLISTGQTPLSSEPVLTLTALTIRNFSRGGLESQGLVQLESVHLISNGQFGALVSSLIGKDLLVTNNGIEAEPGADNLGGILGAVDVEASMHLENVQVQNNAGVGIRSGNLKVLGTDNSISNNDVGVEVRQDEPGFEIRRGTGTIDNTTLEGNRIGILGEDGILQVTRTRVRNTGQSAALNARVVGILAHSLTASNLVVEATRGTGIEIITSADLRTFEVKGNTGHGIDTTTLGRALITLGGSGNRIQDNSGVGVRVILGNLNVDGSGVVDVSRNQGGGILLQNGDANLFADARVKVFDNGTEANQAGGIRLLRGNLTANQLEVTTNHGDGIFAQDGVELTNSRVNTNTGNGIGQADLGNPAFGTTIQLLGQTNEIRNNGKAGIQAERNVDVTGVLLTNNRGGGILTSREAKIATSTVTDNLNEPDIQGESIVLDDVTTNGELGRGRLKVLGPTEALILQLPEVVDFRVTAAAPLGTLPVGIQAAFGALDFTFSNLTNGRAQLEIRTPTPLTEASLYAKFILVGNTPTLQRPFEFNELTQTGARITGNLVTLFFRDGFTGDADNQVNGSISDPGGIINLSDGARTPILALDPLPASIPVGTVLTLTGTVSDFDSTVAELAGNVDFGDGSALVPMVFDPDGRFRVEHTFTAGATVTVQVSVSDEGNRTGSATGEVVVTAANPPVAVADTASTELNRTVIVATLANDRHPDNLAFTIDSFTQPANGSVTLRTDGAFAYSPRAGFLGQDRFQYTVRDSAGQTATATVTVTVHRPSVLVQKVGPRLVVTGTAFADTLRITLLGRRVTVTPLAGTRVNGGTKPVVFANVASISVSTLAGNDTIELVGSGFPGPITLIGGVGNDLYRLGARGARVTIVDPSGKDRVGFALASQGVTLDLRKHQGQTQRLDSTGNTLTMHGPLEAATGSRFADVLLGEAGKQSLVGNGGRDRVHLVGRRRWSDIDLLDALFSNFA